MTDKPEITKQLAIEFAIRLEENEAVMAENAAMMVALEQFDFEWGDQGEIFEALPDGDWWLEDERLKKETQIDR